MRSLLLVWLVAGCGEVAKLQLDAKAPVCGDSVVDPGEACDEGGETATCNDDCTGARCGDSKVNATANEQCDDGDIDNLNGCTNACELRTAFRSTGAEGAFAPAADVTITGGIHNYTTIDIPAGVTVTVDTGIAELRATGAVTINGTINVSGGKGGDGGNDPDPPDAGNCYANGGTGGGTGNLSPGVPTTTALTPCPSRSSGGAGALGADIAVKWTAACGSEGGGFGGGAGGGVCNAGGGGGGFAGGGGGAGYNNQTGAIGATAFGGVGGAGGVTNANMDGSGKTPGKGGVALGAYAGADGTYLSTSCGTGYPGTPGGGGSIGALARGDLAVETTFQPGSGGGGGGAICVCNFAAAGGGGGGGAVRIASTSSITIGATGAVLANGGDGGLVTGTTIGCAGGGGGSGGLIYLSAPKLEVAPGARVSAIGGIGGASNPPACGKGGNGGIGRIRISATQETCTLDGSFTPVLAATGCAPANVAEKTYVAPYPN